MRFGFPSIRQAGSHARHALKRFPLVLGSGLLAAVVAMVMVEASTEDPERIRLLAAATLGLPLFVALETLRERRGWDASRRVALLGAGVVALLAFYLLSDGWTSTVLGLRYIQLSVAFHLVAAFLPFTGFPAKHAFWQYNRTLFLRFLLASLYTVVLYVGLAIALLALDNLFGVDVESEAYLHLLIALAFVFQPWFFLGGLPADLEALDRRTDYPVGLKVFAQFVLIPVVTVYVLILSAYLVRVLITRTWPSGWIGWLVSSVAAAGTLALLLVHPVREREDSRWVDAYGRWFYVMLLPSIGMLFAAIYQRLAQYGFTEPRYFLLVLAFWLAAIALFYGITASRNIRLIPITLAFVALGTLAGPWSAYAVSRSSQAARLGGLLADQGLLADGRIVATPGEVPPEVSREVSATVRYLVETHGPAALGRVSQDLRLAAEAADTTPMRGRRMADEIARAVVENRLGLAYITRFQGQQLDWVTYYAQPFGRPIAVQGYDVLVRLELASADTTVVPVGEDTLSLEISTQPAILRIRLEDRVLDTVPLWQLVDQVRDDPFQATPAGPSRERADAPPLDLRGESGGLRYLLIVSNLNGHGRGEESEITSATADILLAFTRE